MENKKTPEPSSLLPLHYDLEPVCSVATFSVACLWVVIPSSPPLPGASRPAEEQLRDHEPADGVTRQPGNLGVALENQPALALELPSIQRGGHSAPLRP